MSFPAVRRSVWPSRERMSNHPQILLADEPTGNLDPTTSLGIMEVLDAINRTGTTVVMATHNEEIVNSMRKRVVELHTGKIVRDEQQDPTIPHCTSRMPKWNPNRISAEWWRCRRDTVRQAVWSCPMLPMGRWMWKVRREPKPRRMRSMQ